MSHKDYIEVAEILANQRNGWAHSADAEQALANVATEFALMFKRMGLN